MSLTSRKSAGGDESVEMVELSIVEIVTLYSKQRHKKLDCFIRLGSGKNRPDLPRQLQHQIVYLNFLFRYHGTVVVQPKAALRSVATARQTCSVPLYQTVPWYGRAVSEH